MVAVLGNKKEFIFRAVEEMYTEVVSCPGKAMPTRAGWRPHSGRGRW